MKNISFIDIQEELEKNNTNVLDIIDEIIEIMNKEYPNYTEWFKNKLIPGLAKKERNIILVYKKDKIIGMINLKKTNTERKMSNLYVKNCIQYDKITSILINKALIWLETKRPTIIMSEKELTKCASIILSKNWNITRKIKENNDYVVNGNNNEFTVLEKRLEKKLTKNSNRQICNK